MADEFTKLILRSGIEKDREKVIYSSGEPIYVSDYKRLFIGDGSTYGGFLASNRFLGIVNFNLSTYSSGIISGYIGDTVFDRTTNNLYALTGNIPTNIESYARVTRNFTADNITTVLNVTSGISVKQKSLNAYYLEDNMFGRGLEKDPSYPNKIRLADTSLNGGLDFDIGGKLKVAERGVPNSKLADMEGNHVKGNLGVAGAVEDVSLIELANALSPLLVEQNNTFGLPIGTIIDFASNTPPYGFLLCNGDTHSTSEYPELFNIIQYTWGGDGDNFAVPDLRRKTTIGSGGVATDNISNYVGAVGGSETVILKPENIPAHYHLYNSIVEGTTFSLSGNGNANLDLNLAATEDASLNGLNKSVGKPANIIQPSAVVAKCIKAF